MLLLRLSGIGLIGWTYEKERLAFKGTDFVNVHDDISPGFDSVNHGVASICG